MSWESRLTRSRRLETCKPSGRLLDPLRGMTNVDTATEAVLRIVAWGRSAKAIAAGQICRRPTRVERAFSVLGATFPTNVRSYFKSAGRGSPVESARRGGGRLQPTGWRVHIPAPTARVSDTTVCICRWSGVSLLCTVEGGRGPGSIWQDRKARSTHTPLIRFMVWRAHRYRQRHGSGADLLTAHRTGAGSLLGHLSRSVSSRRNDADGAAPMGCPCQGRRQFLGVRSGALISLPTAFLGSEGRTWMLCGILYRAREPRQCSRSSVGSRVLPGRGAT